MWIAASVSGSAILSVCERALPCLYCLLRPSSCHPRPDRMTWPSLVMKRHWQITVCFSQGQTKRGDADTIISLSAFYYYYFIYLSCKSVCFTKAWLSSGVWHRTTNTTVYHWGDDEIHFALSVCSGLPAAPHLFFFSPSLNWLRRRIVLAKMWKGYAWLRTSRCSNLLSTTLRKDKVHPPPPPYFKTCSGFFPPFPTARTLLHLNP